MLYNGYLYFDKTDFIKEFIESKNKLMLVTNPPGWGKTTSKFMLQHFLEFELFKDQKDCNEDIKDKMNFEILHGMYQTSSSQQKKKLKITRDQVFFNEHFEQYIIIDIMFDSNFQLKYKY